ncbi:MAG TPA: ligase-associated DNA damage response exonuclease [Bryobacteraceae bacterium]
MSLIEFTERGLYCAQGAFYIDPWRPVEKAVITHAHSDHARAGSGSYLCHRLCKPILDLRLSVNGVPPVVQTVEWGDVVHLNGVGVSLHPAGHVIGSSQVRVEYNGEVWVVSGDYKTENDGISGAFEPLRCQVFVTESTFGLPIYNWKPQAELFAGVRDWVAENRAQDKTSVLIAYSLGKAQRLLKALEPFDERVWVHGAIWNVHQALLNAGVALPPVERIVPDTPKELLRGQIVIAPPSAESSAWMRRFSSYALAICSGWMQVRGNVRRRNADAGIAMSDHADWKGLLAAVAATGAEKVYVTHGFQPVLTRYLNELGVAAAEVKTEYGDDEEGAGEPAEDNGGKEAPADGNGE